MFPQRKLFVSVGTPLKSPTEFQQALDKGLAKEETLYLGELQKQGKLHFAGVWADYTGGMMFWDVPSLTEAQTIVRNQPVVKAGFISNDVKEFIAVDYAAGMGPGK